MRNLPCLGRMLCNRAAYRLAGMLFSLIQCSFNFNTKPTSVQEYITDHYSNFGVMLFMGKLDQETEAQRKGPVQALYRIWLFV